jgi:hypothetical protein
MALVILRARRDELPGGTTRAALSFQLSKIIYRGNEPVREGQRAEFAVGAYLLLNADADRGGRKPENHSSIRRRPKSSQMSFICVGRDARKVLSLHTRTRVQHPLLSDDKKIEVGCRRAAG